MKLYSVGLSPFAARVRLAIYAKVLPVEILPPAGGGTKTAEYLALNPMGKVPALALADGTVIPESDTIVEYLAEVFPQSGLKPAKPEDAARARLIARVAELYVITPGAKLFGQMAPKGRDQAVIDAAFVEVEKGLEHLNLFLSGGKYAAGDSLTLADCAVVPVFFFVGVFEQVFGRPDLLTRHPKVAAYWASVQTDPAVQKVLGEMAAGLQAARGG